MKTTAVISTILLPLSLVGCVKETALLQSKLQNSNWILSEINGNELQVMEKQIAPRLHIDQDLSVRGHTGCNNFTGQLQQEKEQIRIEQMALTKKMCFGDIMKTEQLISQVLSGWSKASVTQGQLSITSNDYQLVFDSI